MASSTKPKELDITQEEMSRLQNALKDEEFRKLFIEYAQELSDPENRKKYEEEIAELEKNRGMDVKFVNPEPGYVLKTNINGEKKCFINICMNQNIAKPESKMTTKGNGAMQKTVTGYQWSVPYSLSPPRDDLDRASKRCVVYDCVFHPECFRIVESDGRFKKLMEDTALDGIEREFQVNFDRTNIKRPKMKFKGLPKATVIRTPNEEGPNGEEDGITSLNLPYPYEKMGNTDVNGNEDKITTSSIDKTQEELSTNVTKLSVPNEPKYTITHRGMFDFQHFTNAPDSMTSTRPQELVIKVELPLLKSAANIQLDVFPKKLRLESKKPVSYLLDLPLPYPVIEEEGSAKFDKSKSCMVITLPVLPPKIPKLPSFAPSYEGGNKCLVSKIEGGEDQLVIPDEDNTLQVKDHFTSETILNGHVDLFDGADINTVSNSSSELQLCEDAGEKDTQEAAQIFPNLLSECHDNYYNQCSSDEMVATEKLPTLALFPSFTYSQNDSTLTIIIHQTMITSLQHSIISIGQNVLVQFRTVEGDRVEEYKLYLAFTNECAVEENVGVSTTDSNAVVTLTKKEHCRGEWDCFFAGGSQEDKNQYDFPTQKKLQDKVEEIKKDTHMKQSGQRHGHLESSTRYLETDKATFTIQPHGAQNQENNGKSIRSLSSGDFSQDGDGSLHLDVGMNGDSTSESAPFSPYGLKSSLRSPRQRCSKSVSFSENVVVEFFLDQRGKKGKRKSPFIRRSVEKLKDNSWYEVCSDSELFLSKMYQDEDGEFDGEDIWNVIPKRRVVSRQSSSESESDAPTSPKGKGRKSKGSRRRRKEKAKRALLQDSSSEEKDAGWKEKVAEGNKANQNEEGKECEDEDDDVFSNNSPAEGCEEIKLDDDETQGEWIEVQKGIKGKLKEKNMPNSTLEEPDKNILKTDTIEENLIEKNLIEKNLIEKNLIEKNLIEKNLIEKNLIEKNVCENGVLQDIPEVVEVEVGVGKADVSKPEVKEINASHESDDDQPLELQNHHTKCSFALINKIMFELDDTI